MGECGKRYEQSERCKMRRATGRNGASVANGAYPANGVNKADKANGANKANKVYGANGQTERTG